MAYRIVHSIDASFAHHVRGHLGPCINVHGHTWKLEIALEARELDAQGFVVDFFDVEEKLLNPCFALLDHAFLCGSETYADVAPQLEELGVRLLASRQAVHGPATRVAAPEAVRIGGAENRFPGGMKVAVFPFNPSSERLARWLFETAEAALADERVSVPVARVYETLQPVQSYAEYRRDRAAR